ncbi:hypothetical protein TRVA0_064S00430 [Trichomonascus vanleenenianus]|uniref:uncharacterized protein n=1 Tax=Trichomonascus vanleenenianus TaxID=2268995 RepID=UPI003ECAD7A1
MIYELQVPKKLSTTEPYFEVGSFGRKISTVNPEAQIWFNRGLIWTYGFNYEEACSCFEQVIAHDPECAMGYWGLSLAGGPNYNKGWIAYDSQGREQIAQKCNAVAKLALEKISSASPVEAALIRAIQIRYPPEEVVKDFSIPNKKYADAMREVFREFGQDDLDIRHLFADALMNWSPRQLYDSRTGQPLPSSPVVEVRAVLEAGLKHADVKQHPGIPHLYIHLIEMSATPEIALAAADIIRDLVPDSGHLSHMPTHLDVLVGEYRRAMAYNYKATVADDKYFRKHGGLNFFSFYRMHDYHSLIYGAMLAGQSKVALESVDRMEATITEEMLRMESPPMADWLEFFLVLRVHVLIRFGMWEELKKLKAPDDQELYCVTIANIYYGKAIAYSATRDLKNAEIQRELFREATTRIPPTRLDFPNRIIDGLKIAHAMLDGEIEYRRQNYEVAFRFLREAIKLEDARVYLEPWGWLLPARHSYGALSLEQGLVDQAAQAYSEDLGFQENLPLSHQHPKNVWALHGYHECLNRLGKREEAAIIKKQLVLALAEADIVVESSCFCRLEPSGFCCPQ